MWWELWFIKPGRWRSSPQRLVFESEQAARDALNRFVWTCVLFGPDGSVVQERWGLLDFRGNSIEGIVSDRQHTDTTLESYWTVGHFTFGGVQFEPLTDEATARNRYSSASRSKVLFAPDGTPVEFSSMLADAQGVGVALILKLYGGSQYSTMLVGDALASGHAPFVPPGRGLFIRAALRKVVDKLFCRSSVAFFGSAPYRNRSLCYFDVEQFPGVRGHVALTIDDAPCRLGPANSMLPQVRELLARHEATATFMTVGNFVAGHEADMVALLKDGHELGNHGWLDRAYHEDSEEAFARDVEACSSRIRALEHEAGLEETVRWFRAPHGKYTETMEGVLQAKGLINVMCDTYAACPVIQDGAFIGESLARQADHGSIVLIHMPERGFREWCFTGLEHVLEGLARRGFKVVSVSRLTKIVAGDQVAPGAAL
mmetsp:Transcript_103249/g.266923  ORF Transcript_103249/g.266923 Transcript_103249/m.266923 type:complete len:429 (-) Transcript_103249:121-1407(-)